MKKPPYYASLGIAFQHLVIRVVIPTGYHKNHVSEYFSQTQIWTQTQTRIEIETLTQPQLIELVLWLQSLIQSKPQLKL